MEKYTSITEYDKKYSAKPVNFGHLHCFFIFSEKFFFLGVVLMCYKGNIKLI